LVRLIAVAEQLARQGLINFYGHYTSNR